MVPYSNAGTASPSVASTTPGAHQLQQQRPRSTSVAATDPNSNNNSQGQQPQHKRVYQACIPCRRRKVRCDLGSVDNPHDPPCVRCRRESKECFFSATRRKRKADDGELSDQDEYIIRNGRKRLNHPDSRTPPPPTESRLYSDVPLTPGGSQGRSRPLRRPDEVKDDRDGSHGRRHGDVSDHDHGDANQQLENVEAQTVMRRGLYGPHDALDLLYKAATDRSVASEFNKTKTNAQPNNTPPQPAGFQHQRHDNRSSSATAGMNGGPSSFPKPMGRSSSFGASAGSDSREQRMKREKHRHASDVSGSRPSMQPPQQTEEQQPIDPELTDQDPSTQPGYNDAIRAWQRFRFVRAGWFTAHEAIQYIDYYYKYLSPMTPISPPTFSDPSSHLTLLTEEPILSVTLLTIASRYKQLDGPGGHCRSYAIHEQLWTYLRGMIERCLWGQEAFGSGFCGSGSATLIEEESKTSSTAPWRGLRKGSLRTLGTIESLLILTEWHPRALHFPPQDATDELMLPDFEMPQGHGGSEPGEDGAPRNNPSGFGGKRIESWLEPAWRSDRMCWMLLSTGMGLGYELGVFDDMEEMIREDGANRPEFLDEGYRARANRIKRLLLIYTTQLAGRLGWTSMAPDELRRHDPAFASRSSTNRHQHHHPQTVGGSAHNDATTPGTTFSALSMTNNFNYIPDMALDDQIIHCWAGISFAMHMGNEKLFRSRRHTQEIIQSGKYVSLLGDFGPMLKNWAREFELFRLPPFIRCILKIEYEYVRIYVNSLSLQAVVERCTNNATGAPALNGGSTDGDQQQQQPEQQPQPEQPQQAQQGQDQTGPPQLSPQTIMNYGKLPLGQLGGFTVNDQEYVREVVEGSRNLLNEVVTGLLPHGYLKHAPVRTYFRIISGAMFLLKTFALGAPRSDVKASIDLMDATVEALRNCVVDDVHLGIRFADLLESLTSRLRNRFIQAPTIQQVVTSGRSQSPVAGAETGGPGAQGGDWVGGHAQSLRDGLNVQFRQPSPTMEANNISATPFDLTTSSFPYPGGASLGPSTPAAALELANTNGQHHPQNQNHAVAAGGIDATLFDEWNNPGNEMWYLPPGPAFFQNVGVGGDSSTVAMTSEGVNVGGLDLLDYMGMDSAQYGSAMEF